MAAEAAARGASVLSFGMMQHVPDSRPARIDLIVDGQPCAVCSPNRVVMGSGRFWSGYRMELVRIPATGILERVSTPHHRIVFVAGGTCDIRYRSSVHEARHRLSPGAFCFISRGHLFERLAWKGTRCELIMVDIENFGVDPNPIDTFGRTDALFDMYMGLEDARVGTLIGLMRMEIEAGCPTGGAYGEAISVALASRVASLCASVQSRQRPLAPLSARQLQRVTDHVVKNLSQELSIDRLAALVNMSSFHFARCYKKTTGVTPHQFVVHTRIKHAQEMLAQGKRSVGEIAMEVGFASQSHFASVYRKIVGTTPRRGQADR